MFRHPPVHVTNDGESTTETTTTGVFTRVQSFKELFGPHAELANVEERFDSEEISPSLAMTMSDAQLRSLLPDEPLGRVLLVKQLLSGARVMDLPANAFCNLPSRWIAALSLKQDLAYTLIVWFEVTVVVSALWMTISAAAFFNPAQTCAFEDAGGDAPSAWCNILLWGDAILWALSTGQNNVACVGSWCMIQHILALDEDTLPQYLVRNVKVWMTPVLFMISSTFTFSLGLITRAMLMSENEPRGYAAAGCVVALNFVGGWSYWLVSAKSVYGFRWRDAMTFHVGLFGFVSQAKFKKIWKGRYHDMFAPKPSATYEKL